MTLGHHTVTVLSAGETTDRAGDTILSWDTPTEAAVTDCSVQPAADREYVDGRAAVGTRWTLYAPAGTPLTAANRVRFDGDDYEVDGQPQVWDFPPLSHVHAVLRRVEG